LAPEVSRSRGRQQSHDLDAMFATIKREFGIWTASS